MKKSFIVLLLLPLLLLYGQNPPSYINEGSLKYSDGTALLPPGQIISSPCVADWDGDGKKDLIVGYFTYGAVYLFKNSGTNNNPVFNKADMQQLKAGGVNITSPYG